jgi:hypothetical protein
MIKTIIPFLILLLVIPSTFGESHEPELVEVTLNTFIVTETVEVSNFAQICVNDGEIVTQEVEDEFCTGQANVRELRTILLTPGTHTGFFEYHIPAQTDCSIEFDGGVCIANASVFIKVSDTETIPLFSKYLVKDLVLTHGETIPFTIIVPSLRGDPVPDPVPDPDPDPTPDPEPPTDIIQMIRNLVTLFEIEINALLDEVESFEQLYNDEVAAHEVTQTELDEANQKLDEMRDILDG